MKILSPLILSAALSLSLACAKTIYTTPQLPTKIVVSGWHGSYAMISFKHMINPDNCKYNDYYVRFQAPPNYNIRDALLSIRRGDYISIGISGCDRKHDRPIILNITKHLNY